MIFCSSDHLFASSWDEALRHSGIYKIISSTLKLTDSYEKGPRAMRHTYFRRLFDDDVNVLVIRKLSGCKSLLANEKYRVEKVIPIGLIYRMAHPRA
jgi:site-specific recombinase XerD